MGFAVDYAVFGWHPDIKQGQALASDYFQKLFRLLIVQHEHHFHWQIAFQFEEMFFVQHAVAPETGNGLER